jgi:hypothetical protein
MLVLGACATPSATGNATTPAPSPARTLGPAATVDPVAFDVVRGWLDAQNAGDMDKVATFFAPGARVGSAGQLVVTNSPAEVITALGAAPKCHHTITSMDAVGRTVFAEVQISGAECSFLPAGETSMGIQIPVLVVDGKIACTCRDLD